MAPAAEIRRKSFVRRGCGKRRLKQHSGRKWRFSEFDLRRLQPRIQTWNEINLAIGKCLVAF